MRHLKQNSWESKGTPANATPPFAQVEPRGQEVRDFFLTVVGLKICFGLKGEHKQAFLFRK